MGTYDGQCCPHTVAPYTGAWIEIHHRTCKLSFSMSHPTRVRGLKCDNFALSIKRSRVAPYTGAWIEITCTVMYNVGQLVAPYTGAWIEI